MSESAQNQNPTETQWIEAHQAYFKALGNQELSKAQRLELRLQWSFFTKKQKTVELQTIRDRVVIIGGNNGS
jgi:hypothetical protein